MRALRFFGRVDRILRRSLGVSETAPTDTTVKPAPPVDPELNVVSPEEELAQADWPDYVPGSLPHHAEQMHWEVEEVDEEGNTVEPVSLHDEL